MNKKIVTLFILILLFNILFISNINAISYKKNTNNNIRIIDNINHEPLLIENGVIFGRTIMTIKSKPCGPLEFVNISIEGEETKNIKTGLFGFFIVRIPIGKYLITASKFGFHSSFRYVRLFCFKPFAIISLKLEKKGWS